MPPRFFYSAQPIALCTVDLLANVTSANHTSIMLNILSIITGIVALLLAIPSTIPLLGWGNWFVLPIAVVGIGLGALSSSNGGRNFCIIVFVIAVIRLSLGGGII